MTFWLDRAAGYLDKYEARESPNLLAKALHCIVNHMKDESAPTPQPVEPKVLDMKVCLCTWGVPGSHVVHPECRIHGTKPVEAEREGRVEPSDEELTRIFDSAVVTERESNRQHLDGWRALYEAGKSAERAQRIREARELVDGLTAELPPSLVKPSAPGGTKCSRCAGTGYLTEDPAVEKPSHACPKCKGTGQSPEGPAERNGDGSNRESGSVLASDRNSGDGGGAAVEGHPDVVKEPAPAVAGTADEDGARRMIAAADEVSGQASGLRVKWDDLSASSQAFWCAAYRVVKAESEEALRVARERNEAWKPVVGAAITWRWAFPITIKPEPVDTPLALAVDALAAEHRPSPTGGGKA